MNEIPKAYEPQQVEDAIYKRWETSGFFNPDNLPPVNNQKSGLLGRLFGQGQKSRKPFVIMLPPPNATGTLHVGHAMYTVQDVMIRFERMRGKAALWLPGTDHAAVATHAKVERIVTKEGSSRAELGREAFVKRIRDYIAQSRGRINLQLRKMGFSLDWSREAYTFDEERNLVVRTMFKKMYDDGLIYRGSRIVHWCPHCKSALSDDEVEYREEKAPFYYLKYGPVVIGTARPETKFLDKTLVVHPEDERYKDLVGKEFDVPWIDGTLKSNVIADEIIDPEFGTGAMTITPAHSFDDFDLAKRHHLPIVQIITEEGNFTEAAGAFAGKNARESRDEIVKRLKEKGLLDHIDEEYVHNLSICYRCDTALEPLISKQWFVDVTKQFSLHQSSRNPIQGLGNGQMVTLKELMQHVVRTGQIKFMPERFLKIYFHWVDNLRDWCISRQIWFGHQIPVWYRGEETYVGTDAPDGEGWKQETDTLDTWFSSGTWTFSTLGWPEETTDLKRFHPTDVLETGYDIIFFWVARMILMTCYGVGEVPFRTVYLHGLVRDEKGRKMSKSLENTIDPLDVSEKYGTDAVRLSLVLGTGPGQDKNLGEEKIAGFRNFTNKLWNITRYILTTTEGATETNQVPEPQTLADRWLLGRLGEVTRGVTSHLERYELSPAGELLREFTWSELADWYLEMSKAQLGDEKLKESTNRILLYVLRNLLPLWHPFMPFVTEELWSTWGKKLGRAEDDTDLLMIRSWPEVNYKEDPQVKDRFLKVQKIIGTIRNIRATYGVIPGKKVDVTIGAGTDTAWLQAEEAMIKHLARVRQLAIVEIVPKTEQAAGAVVGTIQVSVSLAGLIDIEKEKLRMKKQIDEVRGYKNTLQGKLENKQFVSHAPKAVVATEKEKLEAAEEKLQKLEAQLAELG